MSLIFRETQETTLVLPTSDTRYLGERCRRYIRILNSGKIVNFYFLNYFVYGHFLIFEKHYFALFFNLPI
ncbi:hypothetical protein TSAR_001566, partial [Trichomalopsis sarcophagae]